MSTSGDIAILQLEVRRLQSIVDGNSAQAAELWEINKNQRNSLLNACNVGLTYIEAMCFNTLNPAKRNNYADAATILRAAIAKADGRAQAAIERHELVHAAAPELLAALEELRDIVGGVIEDRREEVRGLMDSFTLQPAHAAIAKATGSAK